MDLEKGQVYSGKEYYISITAIDKEKVYYNFYNKRDYFFPPNTRRMPLDDYYNHIIKPINVSENIDQFLKKLKSKRLELINKLFEKTPILGVIFKKI